MSQHKRKGLDGWKSPGGVKYRAAYAANNKKKHQFLQAAQCGGGGKRAILRPPLTFSATLDQCSMGTVWELWGFYRTHCCQYLGIYNTAARPQFHTKLQQTCIKHGVVECDVETDVGI